MDPTHPRPLHPTGWVVMAYLLIGIYLLPAVVVVFGLANTGGGTRPSFLLDWYFALATNRTSALSEIHQLILPLIAGMSVITLSDPRQSRASWILVAVSLTGFVMLVGVQVLLDIGRYQANLTGLSFTADQLQAGHELLEVQRSNLLIYFAVLAGLKVTSPGGANDAPSHEREATAQVQHA
jgi:hypothetical protein